jgi:hypothetical protein
MKKVLLAFFHMGCMIAMAQHSSTERSLFNKLRLPRTEAQDAPAKVAVAVQYIDSTLLWNWNSGFSTWDVTPNTKTASCTYDANDRITSRTIFSNSGIWNNFSKEDYTYDANGNMTSSLRYIWNGIGWDNSMKMTWAYNSANNLISRAEYYGSGSAWTGSYQYLSTYNSAQDKTQELHQIWQNNAWQDWDKTVYTYDSNHNNLTETSSTYTNSAWVNSNKYMYAYNSANAITGYTAQTWSGSAWKNSERATVNYDIANDPIYFLGELWNNNAWENDAQASFTCTNHDVVRDESQSWINNTWVNDETNTYTYNPHHDELMHIQQVWGGTAYNNWAKHIRTYNASYKQLTYKYYSSDSFGWHLVDFDTWKYDVNGFNYYIVNRSITGSGYGDSTITYYKTVVGLKANMVDKNIINIYPNPSKGVFTIETSDATGKFEVFDLVGNLVFQGEIESLNTNLNLANKAKGIYIVVVSQGKTRQTTKIAIE